MKRADRFRTTPFIKNKCQDVRPFQPPVGKAHRRWAGKPPNSQSHTDLQTDRQGIHVHEHKGANRSAHAVALKVRQACEECSALSERFEF